MNISIAEYCARVSRLRTVVQSLEAGFNESEGLTLVYLKGKDQKRVVLTGEPEIILEVERYAQELLTKAAADMDAPVLYTPFKAPR